MSKMWARKPKKVGARGRGGTDCGGPGEAEEPHLGESVPSRPPGAEGLSGTASLCLLGGEHQL